MEKDYYTDMFELKNVIYYMTSSVSRQDEQNLVLWLGPQVGKMELYCLLRLQALSCKENIYHVLVFYPI